MKKLIRKRNYWTYGLLGAGCAMGLMFPSWAGAEVSDADFKALQDTVQKLINEVNSLEQTNAVEKQKREQDIEQIKELQDKLSQSQQTAKEAAQTSAVAGQEQPQPVLGPPIDEATVNHNFMMLGDAEFQYAKIEGQNGAFLQADFAPIFLYRGGDNILFEAGFDTTLQNNAPASPGYTTTFNLSFAQLNYVMCDYSTLQVGFMLLPLGTYTQRSAGWLNLIPDNPLAVDALLPAASPGVQLLGAIPVGDEGKYFNYAFYCVNGPSSADGTANAAALDLGGNVGVTSSGVTANLHSAPGGGGRLGFFVPFLRPHYDFEAGFSGQTGQWDNQGNYMWSALVWDAALHLGPSFELKGQYMATRYGSSDLGLVKQNGWYGQVGYKLAGLNLDWPVINNVELMGRYDHLDQGDVGPVTRRYTMGYVYYITSTFLFEGDYEIYKSTDPAVPHSQIILQLSYGF